MTVSENASNDLPFVVVSRDKENRRKREIQILSEVLRERVLRSCLRENNNPVSTVTKAIWRIPCDARAYTYCFTLIRFFIIYLFSEAQPAFPRALSCLWPRTLNICNRCHRSAGRWLLWHLHRSPPLYLFLLLYSLFINSEKHSWSCVYQILDEGWIQIRG